MQQGGEPYPVSRREPDRTEFPNPEATGIPRPSARRYHRSEPRQADADEVAHDFSDQPPPAGAAREY